MNWVCESCGYENEYNDESQPTECLCCGEPASEHQLNQARCELEKYHKEQERQRRLEQLRQEAIKQQEKIEHSFQTFVKSVRAVATACIAVIIVSVAIVGFNVYKGNVSLKYITDNIKNITVMDDVTAPAKAISKRLSENGLNFKDNIIQNVNYTTKIRKHTALVNLDVLVDDKKESIIGISKMVQNVRNNSKVGDENRKNNIVVSKNNVSNGISNLTGNCQLFWNRATQNINQLVDYISKKVGRSK